MFIDINQCLFQIVEHQKLKGDPLRWQAQLVDCRGHVIICTSKLAKSIYDAVHDCLVQAASLQEAIAQARIQKIAEDIRLINVFKQPLMEKANDATNPPIAEPAGVPPEDLV